MNITGIYSGGLTFDDVLLVPKFTDIISRLDPDISSSVAGCDLSVPIISSPMDTVTESSMAISIGKSGGMGIIHRFMSIEDHISQISDVLSYKHRNDYDEEIPVVLTVGNGSDAISRLKRIWEEFGTGIDCVLIDVANGYSSSTRDMIDRVKNFTNNEARVIAGNVADGDGYSYLADSGADAVRVGIGGGSICKTKIMTGFGLPTLTSVASCQIARLSNPNYNNVSIIADGGIRYPGDFVKSIAAGADAVMAGGIFAGTNETPGDIVTTNGIRKKAYYGMASKELQDKKRGGIKRGTCSEGVSTMVILKGPSSDVMEEFSGGLRSAMTYAGSMDISSLRENADFIKITSAGLSEAHAYGTRK
jgi:IMP dehydrogenase